MYNNVLRLGIVFQLVINKLKLDKDRRKILDRKAAGRAAVLGQLKGKHTEESVAMDTQA